MDTFRAEYEFYTSDKCKQFAKRLRAYAKVPTLAEMDEYNVYPVLKVDGTSSFSSPPPSYELSPPPAYE